MQAVVERSLGEPFVDAAGLAVVAYSRGTELALLLADRVPVVETAALFAPSAYVWEATRVEPTGGRRSSWAVAGAPIPFVPLALDDDFYATFDKRRLRPFHERGLEAAADLDAVRLPVEGVRELLPSRVRKTGSGHRARMAAELSERHARLREGTPWTCTATHEPGTSR